MATPMSEDVDIVVGMHHLSRRPVTGVLQAIREHEGLTIGRFVPNGAGCGEWRMLLPENPIPCSFVDLTYRGSGRWVRCLARSVPAQPAVGVMEPFVVSPANVATIDLLKSGLRDLREGRRPESAFALAQWADGTRLEMRHDPIWRWVCRPGRAFWSEARRFTDAVYLKLREEAGLAPTPRRFVCDGTVPEQEARRRYLGEVRSRPEVRRRALHILGRCQI